MKQNELKIYADNNFKSNLVNQFIHYFHNITLLSNLDFTAILNLFEIIDFSIQVNLFTNSSSNLTSM